MKIYNRSLLHCKRVWKRWWQWCDNVNGGGLMPMLMVVVCSGDADDDNNSDGGDNAIGHGEEVSNDDSSGYKNGQCQIIFLI